MPPTRRPQFTRVAPATPRPGTRPPPRRSAARPLWAVPVALMLVGGAAVAAVTVTYTTPSTQNLILKDPPLQWMAGPDSSGNNYVASWTLSGNRTSYTITLKPVPEANVTWGNLTTLANNDTASYSAVTVTGTSVAGNAKILDFRMEFRNYGTDAAMGTLNLRDASPSVNLGTLAAGARYYTKVYLKLDTNTVQSDLPSSVTITLSFTP